MYSVLIICLGSSSLLSVTFTPSSDLLSLSSSCNQLGHCIEDVLPIPRRDKRDRWIKRWHMHNGIELVFIE